MTTDELPERPSLQQLRKQARELQRGAAAGDPAAHAVLAEHHPIGASAPATLAAAQVATARRYGFESWPRLKAHVEVIERFSSAPDLLPADADPAVEAVRLACLTYSGADGPERWAAARAVVDAHPGLSAASLAVACAFGDLPAVRAHLAGGAVVDASLAPHGWPPLLYAVYARVAQADAVGVVTALLDAGADPDAGFLWHGLPTPFTALTGVFGAGEQGTTSQPVHPRADELAELLLAAGADPNDGQALYNRMFEADDRHLEVLFRHGLGEGDGGPWRARLGDALETPTTMLRGQLHWAVTHGMLDRISLLARHGVDLVAPFTDLDRVYFHDARTAAELAAANGRDDVVARLVELGAPAPVLSPADALVAAILRGDAAACAAAASADPALVERLRVERRGLIVWAAAGARHDAVQRCLDLGFDVNAKGRGDVPVEHEWQTALHEAANNGDEPLARVLLAAGADPDVRDARFDATPLGWAEHAGQTALAELLRPLTAPPPK